MAYLLHMDTSTDTATVAISRDGCMIARSTNGETRNHAGTLNKMIDELLRDVKISFENINGFVLCAGPGSYTGLRIGMATAKGLCYALDKPLILDNRLTLLAYQAWRANNKSYSKYISLLIARKNEYFISIYNSDFNCLLAPGHIMEEQINGFMIKNESTLIITNIIETVIDNMHNENLTINRNIAIDLESWAFFAFEEYKHRNITNLSNSEPFYLKQVYTHK